MSDGNEPSKSDIVEKSVPHNRQFQVPIVGVGASAGGLEAFQEFVRSVPEDSGFAFILIVHLDPSHASLLSEIIQNKTKMKVTQIADSMIIKPNQIFVIPPKKDLGIINGKLQLLERTGRRGEHLPIDNFFRSLALDQKSKATAIVLSGTGTDGTLGIQAIKEHGGMVMVQDPSSAKFDGMPQSAINTGFADYILPPAEMPLQLVQYFHDQAHWQGSVPVIVSDKMIKALQKICLLLRTSMGHDFSLYKKNTIFRRIEKRMQAQRINDIDFYVRYLRDSEAEQRILFKELLIGVTGFFRDETPFELLKEKYLPDLLKDKPDDYQLRIWVPGCSTGEEVYSIAIIVWEYIAAMGRHFDVQIFGTDLDEKAISFARAGRYPDTIAADMSSERLKSFFTKEQTHYRITKNIREMVVFAQQNLIKDPPFTRLDMICCRNLLIYFDQKLQNKLLPLFNYSLKKEGLLVLGTSETTGNATKLFTVLDKKWKIYKCCASAKPIHPKLTLNNHDQPAKFFPPQETIDKVEEAGTVQLLKAILAESNMPPCAVIDDSANILYIHGRLGRFLEPAEGEISSNILKMARPGLQAGISQAIRQVSIGRQEVKLEKLNINGINGPLEVNLTFKPLADVLTRQRHLMLILFDEVSTENKKATKVAPRRNKTNKSDEVKRLEDLLQTTVEDMEAANEELKSTNEELQSTNEELQSTNEELETSREELQSLNEESVTVNAELQGRIDELMAANDDIKNLLDATDIACIFLDINMKVRRFTPQATRLFPLTDGDIGRPIDHFSTTLTQIQLVECAQKVITDLNHYEAEVQDCKGNVYRMRLRPYRTTNNVIDGVVITFEDITKLKELVDALTISEKLWRGLVENAPMGILILTEGFISYLNPGALRIFTAISEHEMLGKPIIDWVLPDFHAICIQQIELLTTARKPVSAIEQTWLKVGGGHVELVISAAPIIYNKKDSALVFIREKL
ncbi:chemotaxis protein CheB [Desulfopila sp. IMCC35008]|uniref:chemotaxis protein CheB n=1 Tax=Desulfopila sp. IMCC35008 TaxID=2653858 RepID=UPI0013D32AB9|nr:chemotaxis protein CheB [Desulfopila sp. IMCC35008]